MIKNEQQTQGSEKMTMTYDEIMARHNAMTDVQMFRAFNIDMTAISFPGAVPMDGNKAKGNNKYLLRFVKHNDAAKADPAGVPCKIDPKTHEIISGTPERIAALNAHAARVAVENFDEIYTQDE